MHEAVRQLLGRRDDNHVVEQVVRVMRHLSDGRVHKRPVRAGLIATGDDVLNFFRHGNRVNDPLVGQCKVLLTALGNAQQRFHTPQALATVAVASCYPTRPRRGNAEALDASWSIAALASTVLDGPQPFDAFEPCSAPAALIDGLGAANACAAVDRDHRRNGARLFWSTRNAASRANMQSRWQADGELVELIRAQFNVPPSSVVDGSHSAEALATRVGIRVELARRLIELEQLSRRVAKSACDEAWSHNWQRLTTGFPYYAFGSSLRSWWRKTLWQWARVRVPMESFEFDPIAIDDLDEDTLLGLARISREGFRFIRRTFFAQGGAHDRVRRAIDVLCASPADVNYGQLAQQLAIAEPTLRVYGYRLRLRMGAYTAARWLRWTPWGYLGFIDGQRDPESLSAPFHEPGIELASVLGLAVPADQPAILALIPFLWIQPQMAPHRHDKWTGADIEAELEIAGRRGLPRELQLAPEYAERLGPAGFCNACLQSWRHAADTHYVVPVWYLKFVERVPFDEVVRRLKLVAGHQESVRALFDAMSDPHHACHCPVRGSGCL